MALPQGIVGVVGIRGMQLDMFFFFPFFLVAWRRALALGQSIKSSPSGSEACWGGRGFDPLHLNAIVLEARHGTMHWSYSLPTGSFIMLKQSQIKLLNDFEIPRHGGRHSPDPSDHRLCPLLFLSSSCQKCTVQPCRALFLDTTQRDASLFRTTSVYSTQTKACI